MIKRLSFALVLVLVCFSFVSAGITSASIKDYNSSSQIISLKTDLRESVADYKLLSNGCDEQGRFCNATIFVDLHSEGKLYDFLNFKLISEKGSFFTSIRASQIFIFTKGNKIYSSEVSCSDSQDNQTCKSKPILIDAPEWSVYNGQILDKGNYIFLIKGEKRPSFKIDWLLTAFNNVLSEWSIWGNISQGDQSEVRLLSPLNNSLSLTSSVNFTCFANVTNGAYILNISLYDNSTGSWGLRNASSVNSSVLNSNGISFSPSSTISDERGFKILATANTSIINVTKVNGVTASSVNVYASDGSSLLGSASFSGNNAVFSSPVNLTSGSEYYVVVAGSSYVVYYGTASFPILGTHINYTYGVNTRTIMQPASGAWAIQTIGTLLYFSNNTLNFTNSYSAGSLNIVSCSACDSDGVCAFDLQNTSLRLDSVNFSVNSPSLVLTTSFLVNASIQANASLMNCSYNITRGASTEIATKWLNCSNFTDSVTLSGEATYSLNIWANTTGGISNQTSFAFVYSITGDTGGGGGGGGLASLLPSDLPAPYDEMFYFRVFALLSFFVFLLERYNRGGKK